MREEYLNRLRLFCPACRARGKADYWEHALRLTEILARDKGDHNFITEGFWTCSNPDCSRRYPIIKGVGVVLGDMARWWESEKETFSRTACESDFMNDYLGELAEKSASDLKERSVNAIYMESHYGPAPPLPEGVFVKNVYDRFRNTVRAAARPGEGTEKGPYEQAIDLGCSVGGLTFELARVSDFVVGIDTRFSAVTRAEQVLRNREANYGKHRRGLVFERINQKIGAENNVVFLVADALDPPFSAEQFDLVAAFNLIENVRLPLVAIGQMDALLKPGGTLLFSSPYQWSETFCESGEWLETPDTDAAAMIRGILEGEIYPVMEMAYEIEREWKTIPWILRDNDRHWSVFMVHFLKAVKKKAACS